MIKILFTFIVIFASFHGFGQFTSPNTGVNWDIEELMQNSSNLVTYQDNAYVLNQNLVISANDTLSISTDLVLKLQPTVLITIHGKLFIDTDDVIITAVSQSMPYRGFRFEALSEVHVKNTTFEYGGGIRAFSGNLIIDNCTFKNNVSGVSTSSVIAVTSGTPIIKNSIFQNNLHPAIGSAVNNIVSPKILNNYFYNNNTTNNNRPQINLGPTMSTDSLKIIGNSVIGNRNNIMVGGIAVSNFTPTGIIKAIIKNNTIIDNRYGITIAGPNSDAEISYNIIEDNTTQNDPMAGGSGINLNSPTGNQNVNVFGNEIRRNLWGISIQGPVNANLGDGLDVIGGNIFADNGNQNQIYALYNNGTSMIQAKNNCWIEGDNDLTLEEAESVIYHRFDDSSLGIVDFDPVCDELKVENVSLDTFKIYPNPTNGIFNFDTSGFDFSRISVFDLQGKSLLEKEVVSGFNEIFISLDKGIYFVKIAGNKDSVKRKIIIY